jgi:hypothetical protein
MLQLHCGCVPVQYIRDGGVFSNHPSFMNEFNRTSAGIRVTKIRRPHATTTGRASCVRKVVLHVRMGASITPAADSTGTIPKKSMSPNICPVFEFHVAPWSSNFCQPKRANRTKRWTQLKAEYNMAEPKAAEVTHFDLRKTTAITKVK